MKKYLLMLMLAVMAIVLCACGSDKAEVEATAAPDSNAETETEQQVEMPVIAADPTAIPDISYGNYTYLPFNLDNGFTFNVPSHWQRQPASNSVCFTEPVKDGEIPGRVVVTSKKVEAVGENTREKQLRSFFANILGDFETYSWSDIYTDQPFVGDDSAHSVIYSGTRDGLAYKGYVILGAKGTTIYVYHFRCAESEYEAMENIMKHMRDSVSLGLE